MARCKGFLEVAVPGGGRTVRERRADATTCAHCGRSSRTLYDYFDNDKPLNGRVPAFCNKGCAIGYRLEADRRRLIEVDGEPQMFKTIPVPKLKSPTRTKLTRLAPAPKRAPRRRKAHLNAVG